MERVFASTDALDTSFDRVITCRENYAQELTERILPDGAVHLIFNLGDRLRGERGAELSCLTMGATCEPTKIVFAGTVEQICVTLRIGSAATVLGVPAKEVSDRGVSLYELWGSFARELLEQLAELPAEARIARVKAALRERTARGKAPSPAVYAAVRAISESAGRVSIRALADRFSLSERRLQQLFHQQVGLSPKELCRLARFREVLISKPSAQSWSERALDAGFYDQAHFTNELRAFTGLTPTELARRADFAFFQDAATAAY